MPQKKHSAPPVGEANLTSTAPATNGGEALVHEARHRAFALMNEALAVLDTTSTDLLVTAKLQGAVDAFGNIDRSGSTGIPVSPLVACRFVDRLVSAGCKDLCEAIDSLPVPAYAADADGQVTYWNRHCATFAGREPELGSDRWCVTWKLYTMTGDPLPHDQCPMAVAIRERRTVRGEVAVAECPDGRRVAFMPYPTPLFDDEGELAGAINILIDVSKPQREELRGHADYCRRLARCAEDRRTQIVLTNVAENCERSAAALRS